MITRQMVETYLDCQFVEYELSRDEEYLQRVRFVLNRYSNLNHFRRHKELLDQLSKELEEGIIK